MSDQPLSVDQQRQMDEILKHVSKPLVVVPAQTFQCYWFAGESSSLSSLQIHHFDSRERQFEWNAQNVQ